MSNLYGEGILCVHESEKPLHRLTRDFPGLCTSSFEFSFQNMQTLKDVEDAITPASISSESDSGVNMNIDEVVADFTAPNPENCTEGTIYIS